MIPKNYRSKKIFYLTIILVGLILNILIYNLEGNNNSTINDKKDNTSSSFQDSQLKTQDIVQNTITKEWLNNTDFSLGTDSWFSSSEGDPTDIIPNISNGVASYLVSGEVHEKQVILSTQTQSEWTPFDKTENTLKPNLGYGVDDDGCWCGHDWDETGGGQPENTPEIYWRNNVSMGINMSDYRITSLSFEAIINGSVSPSVDTPGDYYSDPPTRVIGSQYRKLDFAQFYIELSDTEISTINTYEIAFNQTVLLGNDDYPSGANPIYDMEMYIDVKTEQAIINALENILAVDHGHDNFTVVLGIYIYCEDNDPSTDRDTWDELRFKSLNLTFTYEKIIDDRTSLSWNQIGDTINHTTEPYYSYTRVDDAKLNFKYSLNESWTNADAEIRFLISNVTQTDYPNIALSSYTAGGDFIEAKTGGYDVKQYILEKEISLSIQVIMLDEFSLDRVINISIDDVYFVISYTVFYNLPSAGGGGGSSKTKTTVIEEPWINLLIAIAAIAGAVCLGGYLVAYQLVLKYPKPVRKVRKYRRTLKRKKGPTTNITGPKSAFKEIFNTKIASIKGSFSSSTSQKIAAKDKIVQKSLQISTEKIVKKSLKKPLDNKSKST